MAVNVLILIALISKTWCVTLSTVTFWIRCIRKEIAADYSCRTPNSIFSVIYQYLLCYSANVCQPIFAIWCI